MTGTGPLLSARGLTKVYAGVDGQLPVLTGIDLDVRDGEILAVLGRSGSGKSTLLRCLAGLVPASSGTVCYRGRPLTGTNPGTAMVFQNFALLPWLTVTQNVELGLQARRLPARQRTAAVRAAVELIGLNGFESTYPKELSGGMRQRVGFARALVVEPDVLLMDEPFSALDVLTAENLRGELLELWHSGEFPTRAIVVVTHNIEEAVLLADRVLVLGPAPDRRVRREKRELALAPEPIEPVDRREHGTIRAAYPVPLDRPRDRQDPRYGELIATIYDTMTERVNAAPAPGTETDEEELLAGPMPTATVDSMAGLVEVLLRYDEPVDPGLLAGRLGLAVDELLRLTDALALLGFAGAEAAGLALTDAGVQFGAAEGADARQLFAVAALQVPLVRYLTGRLRRTGTVRSGFLAELLGRYHPPDQVDRRLEAAAGWGRYAELYFYDAGRGEYRIGPAADLLDES